MKKTIKGFVLGVIITTMLMGTALGSGVKKNIEVVFNSINLTVNGEKVSSDNIVYEGTTYVPLRAAGEMLGKYVGWDAATRTASINDNPVDTPVVKEKPVKSSEETVSQKNAIKSAKKYLEYTAFSKSGLIKQLEFEGYSNEDSTYAVSQINIDWNKQAAISAKKYLEYTSFSRDGLIKQLEFEGYSNQEATYGVDQTGL